MIVAGRFAIIVPDFSFGGEVNLTLVITAEGAGYAD